MQIQKAVYLAHSLAMQGVAVDPALHSALLSACVAMGAWQHAEMMCTATHATQVRLCRPRCSKRDCSACAELCHRQIGGYKDATMVFVDVTGMSAGTTVAMGHLREAQFPLCSYWTHEQILGSC